MGREVTGKGQRCARGVRGRGKAWYGVGVSFEGRGGLWGAIVALRRDHPEADAMETLPLFYSSALRSLPWVVGIWVYTKILLSSAHMMLLVSGRIERFSLS